MQTYASNLKSANTSARSAHHLGNCIGTDRGAGQTITLGTNADYTLDIIFVTLCKFDRKTYLMEPDMGRCPGSSSRGDAQGSHAWNGCPRVAGTVFPAAAACQ